MLHRHPFLGLITAAYLCCVGWMTLTPQPYDQQVVGSILGRALRFFARHDSTDWITYGRVEFGANIAMFVPIGLFFLLLLGRRHWWLAILLGAMLSVGIELSQAAFLPTRYPSVRDVVSNSTGAIIGVLAGLVLTAAKARRIRHDRRVPYPVRG